MKKTLKKVLCLALAGVMTLSLAACTGPEEQTAASYTYNSYMEASPANWNPHTWEMNAESTLMSYIEMGLVDVQIAADGVNFEWVMEMAEDINDITATYADKEKWGIGADETGRVWEIKLNKNAKWANGEVINADTYVYSMQQLLDSGMKNYRAGNYVSGDSAIVGANGYFNNDKVGQDYYISLTAAGYKTVAEAEAAGKKVYVNVAGAWGVTGPNGEEWMPIDDETKMRDEAVPEGEAGDYISAKEIYDGYFAPGKKYETAGYTPSYCGVVGGQYTETPWEEVGLVKVDDYTILYITELSIDEFNFFTACTSNWIVYKDLYDAGKKTTGNLTATNYGTSAETYMSYGPYKLASFETSKQFVLEKNENWYGYTDGKHENQYQTTKVVYQIVANHNTQLQLFNSGKLDDIALTADDMAKYKMSDYLLQTDQTYTFRWIFATDLEALKNLEVEANDGSNKRVLSYDDFRKALSLAMDRDRFTKEATSAYKPAYFLLNSLYYYNIAEDTNSIYRNTKEAMAAVLNIYDIEYTDDNIVEKYKSVSGYDLEEAKKLFQSVYEEAKADGNYTDGQKIVINCCVSKASETTAEDEAQETLMNEFVAAATKGTGFEGKITFNFSAGRENRYQDCADGKIEMVRGAWGGAAFYPFNAMRCYTDASYAGTIHESCGWDPTTDILDITYDFNGDGTAETVKDTFYNWSQKIKAGGDLSGDMSARLFVLAALETGIVKTYQCIPWATETLCSLYSMKTVMGSTDYNIMYGYGGIRHMTYKYTDAEWDAYVTSQGGTLNYE